MTLRDLERLLWNKTSGFEFTSTKQWVDMWLQVNAIYYWKVISIYRRAKIFTKVSEEELCLFKFYFILWETLRDLERPWETLRERLNQLLFVLAMEGERPINKCLYWYFQNSSKDPTSNEWHAHFFLTFGGVPIKANKSETGLFILN